MNGLPLAKWIGRGTPAQSSGDANATIQLPFDGDTSGIADGAMDPDPSALVGTTDSVAMGSLFSASDPAGDAITAAGGYQDPATVASGATLELTSTYSGTVTFAGPTGVLKLDQSGSFAGKIGGQLAIGDVIDLTDITAGASATIGYTGDNSPGTLTVSDGTHIASIALLGNYSLANFTASSDGHGGTSVVDPPSSAQTTPAGPYLDANGWTVFTPSADTQTIYVSSSAGSDSNDGLSASTPVKTIAKGASLLRSGYPDWLLLKKGDTWTNESIETAPGDNFGKGGRSATEPMLISSYGTGARPLIQTSNAQNGIFFIGGSGGNYVAVDGLDFYSYQRDPSNPNYVGDANLLNPSGISQYNSFNWQLIEDCKFSFYGNDVNYSGLTAGANLSLRRNVIVDAYNTLGHSQGLYAENIDGLLLDGNLFDHDGWNASVAGGGRTTFNRDAYLQWNNANVTALNNIFADSSSEGAQFRSGGTIDNNLFVGDSYGLDVGHNEGDPTVTYAQVVNNVITGSTDIDSADPRGGGINFLNDRGPNVTATNNIITQSASTNPVNATAVMLDGLSSGSAGTSAVAVTGNIIYDWPKLYSDLGAGNTLSNEVGPNPLYPDPTRSVGSYAATIGLTASLDAFLAAARSQSQDNWNPALAANAVNNYIRAGFAVTSITDSLSSPGLAIDPPPILNSIVESPSTGDLNAGNTITLTLNLNDAVTVAGGIPTLTLNDGGTATYSGGSGPTSALNFTYIVAAGENTPHLAVTAVNLNGATMQDSAGNFAGLSLAGLAQAGPQIDTTSPVVSTVSAPAGYYYAGETITLTLNMSEAVNVTGTPTLALDDGGTATYLSGTGTNALAFSYTVGAGQNTSDLAVAAVDLGTGTIKDGAGNAADLTAAVTQTGPKIDTTGLVVTASDVTLLRGATGVAMGSLFTASDPAGDAITQYLFWDGNPDPNSGYVVVNGVAQGKYTYIPITAGQLAQTTFQVGTAPDEMWVTAYDGAQWSPWTFFDIIPAAGGYQDPATVASGATLELTSAYSGTVTFAGPTGVLKLDQSGSFAGKIGGQLAIGDVIDFTDITAGAGAAIGYTGNNSPGTLTVSDGTHTASIALLGNYSLANFTAASDGHGGTSVVDPPLPGSQSGNSPAIYSGNDPAASLGALNQQMALLVQHMASAFPTSGAGDGGLSAAGPSEGGGGQLPNLAQPVAYQQHA